MKNLYGKNVFITGISSGIGRATALEFLKQGANVVGVSRSCKEEERTLRNGAYIRTMKMDVTDQASVDRVLGQIESIDIAVLASGMGIAGPAEDTPIEDVRLQMEVNYFGVLRVASGILPMMRQAGHGLIVVVGSVAGFISIPMQSHYSSSKYALEAYVEALRMEVRDFGIRACIVEPGDTRTGFTDSRVFSIGEDSPYYEQAVRSVAVMESDERNGKSPETVARVITGLAAKKNPPARVQVGLEYKAVAMIKRLLPDSVRETLTVGKYLKV